jgi:K+-transporting ATPase ATPase C chain
MNSKEAIKNSIKILLFFTVITGLIYPLIIFSIGKIFFSDKANGSLIKQNDRVIGSKLLGQKFTSNEYFWSRPSAIDYNPMPSGGSNLALTSQALVQQYEDAKSAFMKQNMLKDSLTLPDEMLFASASGVDPDISRVAAYMQVKRICEARKLTARKQQAIYSLIDSVTNSRQFGFLGEETVNVLELNLKLNEISRK